MFSDWLQHITIIVVWDFLSDWLTLSCMAAILLLAAYVKIKGVRLSVITRVYLFALSFCALMIISVALAAVSVGHADAFAVATTSNCLNVQKQETIHLFSIKPECSQLRDGLLFDSVSVENDALATRLASASRTE